MTVEELVNLPDFERVAAIRTADSRLLEEALKLALRRGAAYAASQIAYELGRRSAA